MTKEKKMSGDQGKGEVSFLKKELRLLDEVTRSINSSLKIDEVMKAIIAGVTDTIGAETATLYLVAQDGKIDFSYLYGVSREMEKKLKGLRLEIGQGIVGSVIKRGASEYVHDAQKDKRLFKAVDMDTSFVTRSMLCVPLKIKNKVIGAIQVINKKGEMLFTKEDLGLLETIAVHASISLENARLYQSLATERQLVGNIVENIDEGVLVLDSQLRVITSNTALEKMSGGEYAVDAINGRNISTLFPHLGLQDVCQSALQTGDSFEQSPSGAGTILFRLIPIKGQDNKVENIIVVIKNRMR